MKEKTKFFRNSEFPIRIFLFTNPNPNEFQKNFSEKIHFFGKNPKLRIIRKNIRPNFRNIFPNFCPNSDQKSKGLFEFRSEFSNFSSEFLSEFRIIFSEFLSEFFSESSEIPNSSNQLSLFLFFHPGKS